MESRVHKNKRSNLHRGRKIAILIVFVLLFSVGAYALRLWEQTQDTANSIFKQIDGNKVSTNIKDKKPFAILLLGVDTGADGRIDKGNSDTMIIATINPQKKTTTLTSIPRDTMAQIIGTKKTNVQKVNAAYNIGGSTMAIKTVEKLVNVPIDYYVTINMGALSKIVDAVGGIDVDVPFSFTSEATGGQHFKKGKMHLNGKMALAYSRMRHEDPEGDYGRQKRQQQVIKAIVKAALSMNTLTNFDKIMNTLKKNMATNLTLDDMLTLQSEYRATAKNIKKDQLQGENAYIGGASYQVATTKELRRVSNSLRKELGLKAETLKNAETQMNKLNPTFFDSSITTTENNGQKNYNIYTDFLSKNASTRNKTHYVLDQNDQRLYTVKAALNGTAKKSDSSTSSYGAGSGSSNYSSSDYDGTDTTGINAPDDSTARNSYDTNTDDTTNQAVY
ncbi:Transcriptional regulator [Lactobacillus selangorensis]|uniref:Transcriptional regulator n=1 Tax=Lactobacillus selangorensis TaxID=81857 RepID=A0A0R2FRK3_9LACO|nr:Transcriptional regulator [Lactobacillus selangorensis]